MLFSGYFVRSSISSACLGSLLSTYYRVVEARSPDITWNIMAVELVT